jgi:hypothetical protein
VNSGCFYNGSSTRLSRRSLRGVFAALPVCMRESQSARLTRKKVFVWLSIPISEAIASYKIQEQYSKEFS